MTLPAPDGVVDLGNGFHNLRGSFRLAGLVDIGTHASLVKLRSGGYLMLDACHLEDAQRRFVDGETDGGRLLEAILHLHPFHTLHVEALARAYPEATLYGTARHHDLLRSLPWDPLRTEDAALHARYATDFVFTVPRGVDLVPSDEHVHFASVLALHKASRTIHVDDTLTYLRLPRLLRWLKRDVLGMHPMLGKALQRRAGAADDLAGWLVELVRFAEGADNLCAAHSAVLRAGTGDCPSLAARVSEATRRVQSTIDAHRTKYG